MIQRLRAHVRRDDVSHRRQRDGGHPRAKLRVANRRRRRRDRGCLAGSLARVREEERREPREGPRGGETRGVRADGSAHARQRARPRGEIQHGEPIRAQPRRGSPLTPHVSVTVHVPALLALELRGGHVFAARRPRGGGGGGGVEGGVHASLVRVDDEHGDGFRGREEIYVDGANGALDRAGRLHLVRAPTFAG